MTEEAEGSGVSIADRVGKDKLAELLRRIQEETEDA